ncbi:MAG TPA: NAD-dependent epimerase/dehydratase family protein [Thermoplasmatales archaeon]|nr:NAD-dependent epimerase/dehydratase family protein [Thermoplasmatales archaeon]
MSDYRILVTGATGQIGSELTVTLREKYGKDNVIAMGHRRKPSKTLEESGPYITGDVRNRENLEKIIREYDIDTVYHMAAILSATGENNPQLCWDVNVNGLYNLLEIAREKRIRIFCPSSIAVFGPSTPKENTPQDTILTPTTMYGITKVVGELLGEYYVQKYGVDVRGVRYPGIISSETPPGGGTTDYAVEMFYYAVKGEKYTCFVREDTVLPMMYMPDCLKATIQLMEADFSRLKHHTNFNVSGMSFSAKELEEEIRKYRPDFECEYKPDFRQKIAETWPRTIDDSCARQEWGWKPDYDLEKMVKDMLERLEKRLSRE